MYIFKKPTGMYKQKLFKKGINFCLSFVVYSSICSELFYFD